MCTTPALGSLIDPTLASLPSLGNSAFEDNGASFFLCLIFAAVKVIGAEGQIKT